ncbi:MAG: hypothetical protein IJU65_04125, partial [Desulfovibrio sp.]|nr:hypothetical protein [Desulfovibrio sp.]
GTDSGEASIGDTSEVLTINNATLAADSTYTLTVGSNSVTTAALADNNIATLVSAIEAADGYDALGCTVTGTGSALTLTWTSPLEAAVSLSLVATSYNTSSADNGTEKTAGSDGTIPEVVTTQGVDATDASDSNPVNDGWDVITGFDATAGDTIKLPGNTIATTATGMTITNGVVTAFDSATEFADKVEAVFTGLAATTDVVAFVDNGNTYVCMGDGKAGASETDIMVELQGVELTELTNTIVVNS